MSDRAILFETVSAAQKAYQTLRSMIDVSLDCNAVLYDKTDEKLVRWLLLDDYCYWGAARKVYLHAKQKSVLLVGNNRNLLLLLKEYLNFMELLAVCAESEAEAWRFYCQDRSDIIISDIAMEKIDSDSNLLYKVKQINPSQPFIFLSSHISIVAKHKKAFKLSVDERFGQLLQLEELLLTIDRLLLVNNVK